MYAYSKKIQETMALAADLQMERDHLRELYKTDSMKINAAGFDSLDTLIEGRPQHKVLGVKDFARWLAKEFDGNAGLDESHWLERASTYLKQGEPDDLPF